MLKTSRKILLLSNLASPIKEKISKISPLTQKKQKKTDDSTFIPQGIFQTITLCVVYDMNVSHVRIYLALKNLI